ncbi:class I SAM-dependent DNA methyltransferase [Pseudoponticoccus marisrubri]|uniref:Methyltransferase type 11 n=1 Tax=Pseudoponticoccus marisrubri TaxID=1685382 RepID=A0A0W7WMF8_9RHOB|nr:methyltransferase domain-containing protein [Pseudoponticoccus marisrubri]KUF11750.1 methyltransferase type 11 [Pseudoponticoccus marisrubri]
MTDDTDSFFDKVYKTRDSDGTRALYDDWSTRYEAEVAQQGYATPGRCAQALHAFLTDPDAPILDMGCGTGLSGLALRLAGFTTIDGRDLSPGMLEEARKKEVYRDLSPIGPDDPLPEGYSAICAIGVIGAGAAPLSVLDRIVEALPSGGLTVFSFNDHTLQDPAYHGRVEALIGEGVLREHFREDGPHLPGMNMNATVYVLEKV